MNRYAVVIGSLVLGLATAAYAQNDIVAHLGQASVTQADVREILNSLSPEIRARLLADPAKLDQIVQSRLAVAAVLAEANAKKWDQQPQVQAMIDNARREILVRSYLTSVSAPAVDYPSDADIQNAYSRNQDAFAVPRSLHWAQIYIAIPPNADTATLNQARKHAGELAHQAHAAGADFAALAQANSEDKPSAAQGGDMGIVADNLLLPEIRSAAEVLKPSEVAGPIQTANGFHVIRLIDAYPARVRPIDEVKEQIRAELKQQRAQQNAQAYMSKLLSTGSVAIDEAALGKVVSAARAEHVKPNP